MSEDMSWSREAFSIGDAAVAVQVEEADENDSWADSGVATERKLWLTVKESISEKKSELVSELSDDMLQYQ